MLKVLKLYSQTCEPCKALSPILSETLEKFTDFKFEEVDVGTKGGLGLAVALGVRSVPTVFVVEVGTEEYEVYDVVNHFTGAKSGDFISNFLEESGLTKK